MAGDTNTQHRRAQALAGRARFDEDGAGLPDEMRQREPGNPIRAAWEATHRANRKKEDDAARLTGRSRRRRERGVAALRAEIAGYRRAR